MKRTTFYLILTLLTSISIYQYLSYRKNIHKLLNTIKEQKRNYHKQIEERETVIYSMKENLDIQIQNEGRSLESNITINEGNDKIYHLKDIIQDDYLIVRLGETNCPSCVNALMTTLQKQKIHRIIFLIDYKNEYFMHNLKRYQPKSRFFKRGLLPIPIDSLNIPYLFVLDKNLNINHLFIPNKEMLSQTKQYLEIRNQSLQ